MSLGWGTMLAHSPENKPAELLATSLAASAWCVIGGGNMAQAIVLGAIEAGTIARDRFAIVEIEAEKRKVFLERGIAAHAAAREGLERLASIESSPGDGHVLLAIKPQVLRGVAAELQPLLPGPAGGRRVVSILAGTPTAKLQEALGVSARVIRAMPNTPARIRRGTTALACGRSCRKGDENPTRALFESLGTVVHLDESLFDAFTAIAGSGPAYVFYLAEALIEAAIEQGFPPSQADSVVRSMLAGSADLLSRENGQSAGALRAAVTSKGGTTASATQVFDDARLMDIVSRAINSATERGRELSK